MYNKFVAKLSLLSSQHLYQVYTALSYCSSYLKENLQELLSVLFSPDNEKVWCSKSGVGNSVIDAYSNMILNLMSTNISFLKPFLFVLVDNMFPVSPQSDNKMVPAVAAETKFENVHRLLREIGNRVPVCPIHLFPILSQRYPHHTKDVNTHKVFVQNLLKIADYFSSLRSKILGLIINKIIQLDVSKSICNLDAKLP